MDTKKYTLGLRLMFTSIVGLLIGLIGFKLNFDITHIFLFKSYMILNVIIAMIGASICVKTIHDDLNEVTKED